MLSQPETLRHLIALTLNRGSELPPEVYFERYQQLLALCTPVIQAHEAALQAEFDAAAAPLFSTASACLPPHELARVRRVHQRGQAEPAQLQP